MIDSRAQNASIAVTNCDVNCSSKFKNSNVMFVKEDDLLLSYLKYADHAKPAKNQQPGIYISSIEDLTLSEFIKTRKLYCKAKNHSFKDTCCKCSPLLQIAKEILNQNGISEVSTLFRSLFQVKYQSDKAIRRLMQLPVVVFQMQIAGPGSQMLYVTERRQGVDMLKLCKSIEHFLLSQNNSGKSKPVAATLPKESLSILCKLASSESDRLLIKYTACKSQGMSSKEARKVYGFENFHHQEQKIMNAISAAESIRKSVIEISKAENAASLRALGILIPDETESESGSASDDVDEQVSKNDESVKISMENSPIGQSEQEYNGQCCQSTDEDIDSSDESDSVNPDDWLNITDLDSEATRKMVIKQRSIHRRKAQRKFAKAVAKARLLKRKMPKRVSRILKRYPNIGSDIENFVKERKVGADAWRRTGVLTFTYGKTTEQPGQRVSYGRIKKHLEEKYATKFGYGTIVQLCVARNRRRISAKRYKGIAKITCRKSRKGFSIKFNPDAHYSTAMYRGLGYLQLTDGRNTLTLNRDDAACRIPVRYHVYS